MEIARAAVTDAAAILALQRLAYQREAHRYADPYLPPLRQILSELVDAFATHGILKASVDTAIVGSVRAYAADGSCSIGRLMVHPQWQRLGIGTALMAHIEAQFRGVAHFQLFTGARSTDNIRLYRRLGYMISATERVDDRITLVRMTKVP